MGRNKERLKQTLNPNERHSSGISSRDYRYRDLRFRNSGSSKEMNINGSGGAVDFFLGPPAGEVWYVDYLTLMIIDPGDMNFNVFGGLVAALANGVELIEKIGGVENIYTTLEDNSDIAQCFFGGTLTSAGPAGSVDLGFLNEVDKALGRMAFDRPITLDGDDDDRMIIRINDDLLLLQAFRASGHIAIPKIIPA